MTLRDGWRRFMVFYKGAALLLLNTVVLLVLVGLGAAAWFSWRPTRWPPGPRHFQELHGAAARVYPGRTTEEVKALLDEIWSRSVEYQPFYEFKERAYRGRFVNVSEEGFRRVRDQGPWPPSPDDLNVFVFGGSTTFGYGIADDETLASFLQEELKRRRRRPVRVYNFGCAYHYSSQERARFQQLLIEGFVPHLAVFVDGLNDFHAREEWPTYTRDLHQYMEDVIAQRRGLPPRLISLDRLAAARRQSGRLLEVTAADEPLADRLIARYLDNKKMIEAVAAAYGVRPVFVWQPISVYGFDWKRHHNPDSRPQLLPRMGTERMAARLATHPLGPEFIWAADIQAQVPDPLYVDGIHYAPNLCRAVAQLVAREMEARGLWPDVPSGSAAGGR
jgi:hypothetical protein